MEEEVVGRPPELDFVDAGDGGVAHAVQELPGKPDGFNGLLLRLKDMAMVVYDGTLGEIKHGEVPSFGKRKT
jgi:hypothetical protein